MLQGRRVFELSAVPFEPFRLMSGFAQSNGFYDRNPPLIVLITTHAVRTIANCRVELAMNSNRAIFEDITFAFDVLIVFPCAVAGF